jgi:hypothetical protein
LPIATRPATATPLYVRDDSSNPPKFNVVQAIDLKGCSISCADDDAFASLVYGGDANHNRSPDVSVTAGVRFPWGGRISLPLETMDLPVDQALALMQAAAGALTAVPVVGPPLAVIAQDVIGVMRIVYRKF